MNSLARLVTAAALTTIGTVAAIAPAVAQDRGKLDRVLQARATRSDSTRSASSSCSATACWMATPAINRAGGRGGARLACVNGQVAEIADTQLDALTADPSVLSVHLDRSAGLDAGLRHVALNVPVARSGQGLPRLGRQRRGRRDHRFRRHAPPRHRPHRRQQLASAAGGVRGFRQRSDVTLRRLRSRHARGGHHRRRWHGFGWRIRRCGARFEPDLAEVLDAIGPRQHQQRHSSHRLRDREPPRDNIRVINLSVGAAPSESFFTDPFTPPHGAPVQAGHHRRGRGGQLRARWSSNTQYGGITAPGNAPWVLTVGAIQSHGHCRPAATTWWPV